MFHLGDHVYPVRRGGRYVGRVVSMRRLEADDLARLRANGNVAVRQHYASVDPGTWEVQVRYETPDPETGLPASVDGVWYLERDLARAFMMS